MRSRITPKVPKNLRRPTQLTMEAKIRIDIPIFTAEMDSTIRPIPVRQLWLADGFQHVQAVEFLKKSRSPFSQTTILHFSTSIQAPVSNRRVKLSPTHQN